MSNYLKILLLEDSPFDADLIQNQLRKAGMKFDAKVVSTRGEFIEALNSFNPDLILSDHSMPQFNSIEALKVFKSYDLHIPFILVTGSVSEEFAVQTLQEGANDYILKDRLGRLPDAILNALEKQKLEIERQKYVNEIVAKEALVSKVEKLAHIGSWENDFITGTVKWSDENYRILGYEPGEIKPSREAFLKAVHPLDQLGVKRAIEAAEVKNDHSIRINCRILDKNKNLRYLVTEMFFERDDNNKPILSTGFIQDVSAFKLAEEQLNKSHEELTRVLENVDECFFSFDTATLKFVQVSAAVENIYGYTAEEFLSNGRLWYESIVPEDKPIVDAGDEKIYKGESTTLQYRIIHRDGNIRWLESKVIPVMGSGVKVIRIEGVVRDITEKKESELNLVESEKKYRYLFENSPLPMWIIDMDSYKFLDVNDTALWHFGYSREEFLKMDGYDMRPESEHKRLSNYDSLAEAGKTNYNTGIWKYLKKDGTVIDAEVIVHSIPYEGKRARLALINDITEKIQIEENLHRSQVHLLSSQNIGHVGSWEILDITINDPLYGSPLYWSDETFRIFGLEPGEIDMTTNSFLKMVHPDDRDAVNSAFNEAFNNRKTYNIDHRIIRSDLIERIVHERGEIIYDQYTGKRNKMIGTIQDITERKIAELEREKITADLIQRNKDLEQFTYIVSHNLRAPVANIIGFSDAIFNTELNEEDKKGVAEGLSASVHRLDEVILDLNNILKIKSEFSETMESVKFSSIVDDIKITNQELIEKENVLIKTDFNAIDEWFTIKSYLYSIFYNLISNSIKYRRPNASCVVEITSAKIDKKIILSFKDNGSGIDLNKKGSQVFGLYKRFHTNIEGKGVGLFMVKTQVGTLGGKISVRSEVNKGTEFVIEFNV